MSARTNAVARTVAAVFSVLALASAALADTLRVGTWNVTNYGEGDARDAAFQAALFGSFEGRSFSPDVLLVQEVRGSAAATSFLSLLNSAPGSSGDWAMAPFVEIDPLDNATFYRTSKVSFLASFTINPASGPDPEQPRDTIRYDLQVNGTTERIGLYNVHFKSGSGSVDQARRQVEADRIRRNAAGQDTNGAGTALPSGYHSIIAGDFNAGSANQEAIQTLWSQSYSTLLLGAGQFHDPVNATGTWSGSSTNRHLFTNDPLNGLDDRFDLLGLSTSLIDGVGIDYIGLAGTPFSGATWNDPSHSYRVWGNDGTQGFDRPIAGAGNTMVGESIANAMLSTMPVNGGGHLPVFLDITYSPTAGVAPEPGTLWLALMAGAGTIGGMIRRRRA